MNDIDKMKKLKTKYTNLIIKYGEEVTEYKAFRKTLLELNKQHRATAIQMYFDIISKIEEKIEQDK